MLDLWIIKKYSFSIKGNNIKEKVCVPVDSMYKKGKKIEKVEKKFERENLDYFHLLLSPREGRDIGM